MHVQHARFVIQLTLLGCLTLSGCSSTRSSTTNDGAVLDLSQSDSATRADGKTAAADATPDATPVTPIPAVDILLVIDDSYSMLPNQTKLMQGVDTLIDGLLINGALPDLHIGVVSTDLGTPSRLNGCAQSDQGKLQNAPTTANCTPPSDGYISHQSQKINVPNASDPIQGVKDALRCIGILGTGGCGFEQQLESMALALDVKNNPGFRRPGAVLGVLILSDEDDCSASDGSIFDPAASLTSSLGKLGSFRCFEFGVTCDVDDRTVAGARMSCQPRAASDPKNMLFTIDRYSQLIRGLTGADRAVVAVIAGPPHSVGVKIEIRDDPALEPSCQTANGVAAPAVRLASFANTFGKDGLFSSICESDYGATLSAFAKALIGKL